MSDNICTEELAEMSVSGECDSVLKSWRVNDWLGECKDQSKGRVLVDSNDGVSSLERVGNPNVGALPESN